jgi:hypothetical protein
LKDWNLYLKNLYKSCNVIECCDDKVENLCYFFDFRKSFDIIPRTNLLNILEDLKVPFKLRDFAVRLYEKFIAKFRNTEGWSKEIYSNIGVKQCCPLSPTLFDIYIDKLEYCLEGAGCVVLTLASIVIILLLYAYYIVLMVKSLYDLGKQIIILKDLCSRMGMIVNTDKTKVMIIKSKWIT